MMYEIRVRFYEELNDFLPQKWQKTEFSYHVPVTSSIKHVIESLGVPHTEVDLILVNQHSVNFSYLVQPDDRISVYPIFESFDISGITRLRPKPLRNSRFILDVHLGKLAVYLRFLGYDTLYRNDYQDDELAKVSTMERRILLTRDNALLKRRTITYGYYIHSTKVDEQLKEVFRRFQLSLAPSWQPRCTRCNSQLQPIAKEQILDRLLPETRKHYHQFSYCAVCDHIYWEGSHYRNMFRYLRKITDEITI